MDEACFSWSMESDGIAIWALKLGAWVRTNTKGKAYDLKVAGSVYRRVDHGIMIRL